MNKKSNLTTNLNYLKGEKRSLWPEQLLLLAFQDASRSEGGDAHPVPEEEDDVLGTTSPLPVGHLLSKLCLAIRLPV